MSGVSLNRRKKIYKSVIFKEIQSLVQTSRVELSSKLGINKNTVTSIVEELLDEGLVKEEGTLPTNNVGRNPTGLTVNPEAFHIIGIFISADKISLILTDFHSKPIKKLQSKISSHEVNIVIAIIKDMVEKVLAEFEIKKILGIGVGIPGILDDNNEVVKYSSHLSWKNVELKKLIKETLNLDMIINLYNSVKIAAIGEIFQDSHMKKEIVFYCSLGHGVGGSIVIAGKTIEGKNKSAGEFGHITIDPQGPLCNCGNRGCLEALISTPNLVYLSLEKIRATPESPLNKLLDTSIQAIEIDELVSFANNGEKIAVEVIQEAGKHLGTGLSYVVNLLNPDRIIISGKIVEAQPILFASIMQELRKKSLPSTMQDLQIQSSRLGEDAVSIGAATSIILNWTPKK